MNELHTTPDPTLFGGTTLAIAYTSDVKALQPSDMTVISVNYTSPWAKDTVYQIPQLGTCPEGGCLCTWNWIHQVGLTHRGFHSGAGDGGGGADA